MTSLRAVPSSSHQEDDDSTDDDINSAFVPKLQHLASAFPLMNAFIFLSLACALLCFPQKILSILFNTDPTSLVHKESILRQDDSLPNIFLNHVQEKDTANIVIDCVARLAGGILMAQAVACLMLLYPLLKELSSWSSCERHSRMAVWNVRTSIAIQSTTGLLWIIVGLLNDYQEATHHETTTFGLLLVGFVILILSCFSLMLSFWPVVAVGEQTQETPLQNGVSESAQMEDLLEPLLTTTAITETSENEGDENMEDDVEVGEEQQQQPSRQTETGAESDTEPTSRIRGTRRLLTLAAPQVVYLYVGCITLLIRLPFSLSIPHFVSTTLGALSRGEFDHARREVLWLFILGTIDACLDFWCIFWFGYANQRIVRGVRIDTFFSILKQDVGFFDEHTSGELASRLNSDCGEMAGDLTWFFRFSIESVVRITGITSYMLARSPKLGACALSIVPVVDSILSTTSQDNAARVQDALAAANSVAQETLACIRTVIAFTSEDMEYRKYVDRINEQYRLNVRQTYMTGIYFMFVSTFLINTVVQGTLLLVGSYMIERGNLTSEVLLAFMLYQGQLQNEMMNLFNSYSSLIKSSGAGDKVFEILDRQPPAPATGSFQVQRLRQEGNQSTIVSDTSVSIRLENVHFAYPSRPERSVLKGIDLNIDAGSTVALVGPSGCGKSTIVSLLQRYYDVSSGIITIDGSDIKSLDLKAYRKRIGIVTQDPTLFSGTILSNITYGLPEATLDQVEEAARLANAHEFIRELGGYSTEVGERGQKLSGGQKQRIAIARAIIRRPSLLLLDEATSALDAESEEIVQNSIDNLLKQSSARRITTIIVAHRLRTVRNANMIACVNDGEIVEIGSHDELVKREDGYYNMMVAKSLGGVLVTD